MQVNSIRKDGQSKYYTNKEVREKIDNILHAMNAKRAQMLGMNSTAEEKAAFRFIEEKMEMQILKLCPIFYLKIVPNIGIPVRTVKNILDGNMEDSDKKILQHLLKEYTE